MKPIKISLAIFTLVFSVLILANPILAHIGEDEYAHHSMMGGMMYGAYGTTGMLFGWLFSILVLVALILLIFWLIKQIQKK